jgi:ribosomal protein L9
LVKAKKFEFVTSIQKFSFTVKSPWYRSIWAYFLFNFNFWCFSVFKTNSRKKTSKSKKRNVRKTKKSLNEQAEKHRQEMLLEKQKQLELEQNKLKEEIRNKTIELATKAKDDYDKNRLLQIINEKIVEAENNPNISKLKLGEIRRLVKTYLETEDHTFEIQMDELHQEF